MKKNINKYDDLIRKSIGASLLIALGVAVSLTLNNPLGAILFAFGLLGVCVLGLNLFTGKCGFILEKKINIKELIIILIVNLISGYLFGIMLRYANPSLIDSALLKIETWDISFSFFIKSFFCGVIMYLAVKLNESTKLGILYGIPLFILCGFQHCIANVITLGIGLNFSYSLIICIIGNFIGSLFTYYITKTNK